MSQRLLSIILSSIFFMLLSVKVLAFDNTENLKLMEAITNHDIQLVKKHLESGADANYINSNGWFPLLRASKNGYLDIVKLLIEKEANINLKNTKGYSALHKAAYKGHIDIVNYLLNNGADINNQNHLEDTVLATALAHVAMGSIKPDVMFLLLEKGADPYIKNDLEIAPIKYLRGIPKAMGIITPNNYSSQAKNTDKRSENFQREIILAGTTGNFKKIKELIKKGADINYQDKDGRTALHFAVHSANEQLVETLLKSGATPDVKDNDGFTPGFLAPMTGNKKIISLIKSYEDK